MRKLSMLLVASIILAMGIVFPIGNSGAAPVKPKPKPRIVTVARAELVPEANSTETARGTARLVYNARSGKTTVTLTVRGLKARSSHAAHIHLDSCDGPVAYTLKNVVANRSGTGHSTTVIRARINVTKWYINVHRDRRIPSPGITCGKVEAEKYSR